MWAGTDCFFLSALLCPRTLRSKLSVPLLCTRVTKRNLATSVVLSCLHRQGSGNCLICHTIFPSYNDFEPKVHSMWVSGTSRISASRDNAQKTGDLKVWVQILAEHHFTILVKAATEPFQITENDRDAISQLEQFQLTCSHFYSAVVRPLICTQII